MSKGWLELESDPGLFTLLLEDFGAQGVQVEEIYDLQKPIEGPVYGFIFLFKWIEERRSRRKVAQEEESFVMDDDVINQIFFAQQIIPNSCATHALLSVLLNSDKVKLGETLTKFREFTKNMNPEDKGFAIGNMPDLAKAHNSHARPEPFLLPEKQQGISVRTKEAFHFVSYVPIGGRLFKLDGLKPSPIDHGPWGENEEWTENFRRVISERLGMATGGGGEPYHDIRFNLMAVVPDRRQMYEQKLKLLKTNRQIVLEALQQMVNVTGSDSELSPASRQAVRAGKTEQIITRSLSSKDCQLTGVESSPNQPLRSARLKLKAEAAAAAMAAAAIADQKETEDCPSQIDLEHGNTDFKIVLDNQDDVLGLPTSVSQNSDITGPLMINTKFSLSSPGPGSSSTDTASEVASFLSSPTISTPNSAQCSPNVSPDKKGSPDIPVAKMELEEKLARARELQVQLEANGKSKTGGDLARTDHRLTEPMDISDSLGGGDQDKALDDSKKDDESADNGRSKFGSHQGFTPKDLIELLKNVENEIHLCEDNLRDEVEKRARYKIDDCRRTHNYDQYICTFLSMLAEQGHLAGLVEEHMLVKRRQGINVGRLTKSAANQKDKKKGRAKKRK